MKIRTEQVIDVGEWDAFVRETYGRQYSLLEQNGFMSRRHIHVIVPEKAEDYERDAVPEVVNHAEVGVSFAAWLARDPKALLANIDSPDEWHRDLWWDRNFYPELQMVANDLHARGLLEAGEYTIDIDW